MSRALIILLLLSANCFAKDVIQHVKIGSTDETIEFVNSYNLDRCLQFDSLHKKIDKIPEQKCSNLKNHYEQRAEKEIEAKAKAEEDRINYEQREAERVAAEEKLQLEQKQAIEKRRAEEQTAVEAREIENAKQDEAYNRAERAAQKKQNAKIASLKSKCGDDYKNPQIGMTLSRVKECVAPVKLVSQVNRADGVASLYQSGNLWLNVMEGKVIAWGK